MTPSVAGATAVVTGGASGIGLAVVERLATAGADVVSVDVDEAAGSDAAVRLGARFVAADVSETAGWDAVAAAAGRVDLAFLNAGVTSRQGFFDASAEELTRVLRVNLEGAVLGIRALTPLFGRDGGAIVVTGSAGGVGTVRTDPVYTASKHGLVGLVRAAAAPLATRGVRISAVCPTLVATPLLGKVGELMHAAGFGVLQPEEVADVLVRAALEAESGAIWGLRPDLGVFVLEPASLEAAVEG